MFALAPVPRKRSASASVQVSEAAFAAAYAALGCVGACAWPAEMRTKRPRAAPEQVGRERLRRVLEGADEKAAQEFPVLERRLLDRRTAAPAADEVDEPVDSPVSLGEPVGPLSSTPRVEQVDHERLDALAEVGPKSLERTGVASCDGEPRTRGGEAANDRRAQVPGAPGNRDHTAFERHRHPATLATRAFLE